MLKFLIPQLTGRKAPLQAEENAAYHTIVRNTGSKSGLFVK